MKLAWNFLCVMVALGSVGLAGCDELTGTSEGKVWTIATQESQDGPRLTLKMKSKIEDDKTGKEFPLEIELTGQGGSEWGGGMTRQGLMLKLISVGGPPIPEDVLMFVPDGNKRNPFGPGDPASEVRTIDGKSVNCPTFTAHGTATSIRGLVGSKFVNASIGPVKFYIDDEQVRAMAELMRRLDASVPK